MSRADGQTSTAIDRVAIDVRACLAEIEALTVHHGMSETSESLTRIYGPVLKALYGRVGCTNV